MMSCLAFNIPCLALLLLGELVTLALQIVHLALVVSRTKRHTDTLELFFELTVALHLAMAADFTCACAYIGEVWLVRPILGAAWSWRLWVNAVATVLAVTCAVRRRDARALAAAVPLALCTPPAMAALGPLWNAIAMFDVAFFLARGVWELVDDAVRAHSEPTYLSVLDAVNTMPVGALVVEPAGRALLLNGCMRELLVEYGLPVDLGDLHGTWACLERHARSAPATRGLDEGEGERLVLDAPDGRVLLVKRVEGLGEIEAVGIYFLDVSNLDSAVRDLEDANVELSLATRQLEKRLTDVERIAEQAAYLRMRARVHDVVGQRLSIVQRYLEADRIDDEAVTELSKLLISIARDLREPAGTTAVAALDAVVEAFSLVDIAVSVNGELPDDERAADVFVRIVREATTNACRHAHAHTVDVEFKKIDGAVARAWTVAVTNDGEPPADPLREGGGISGMRRAVEDAGGTLCVETTPTFAVKAQIPLGAPHKPVRSGMTEEARGSKDSGIGEAEADV